MGPPQGLSGEGWQVAAGGHRKFSEAETWPYCPNVRLLDSTIADTPQTEASASLMEFFFFFFSLSFFFLMEF